MSIWDSSTPIFLRYCYHLVLLQNQCNFRHKKLIITLITQRRKPSKPSSSLWPAAPWKEPYQEANPYMMSSRPRQDPEPDPLLSQFICGGADQTEPEPRDGGSRRHRSVCLAAISDVQRWARWYISGHCFQYAWFFFFTKLGSNGVFFRSRHHASQVELEERLQRIEFLREIITSTIL